MKDPPGDPLSDQAQSLIYAEELATLYQQEKDRANELQRANGRLEIALERMRAAEKMREQLIQNFSHEMRTPLTPIIGWAIVLKSGKVPHDQVAGAGETIAKQAQGLLKIVNSLLRVASLPRSTQRTLTQEKVDVNDLLTEARRSLGDPEIRISIEPDASEILTNREYIVEAISYVIDNAVKFSPEGKPPEVSVRRIASGLEFAITDRGPGVPVKDRDKIFDAFVQGDGTTTREHGGLGLGLYLTTQLVRTAGGEVELTDTPGGGGTVTIRLPQRRDDDAV
ncbi:MAG: sensor histidine kinase [Actinomycetota bacterium]